MKHREAEDGKIAELYLNQELTPEKELAFEEHLLSCEKCRKKIQMTENAREAIEISQLEKFRSTWKKQDQEKSAVKKRFSIYRIAAVIILLLGFAGIGIIFFGNKGSKKTPRTASVNREDTLLNTNPADSTRKVIGADSSISGTPNIYPRYIAENFSPNVFYENLVHESFRNSELTLLSPEADTLQVIPAFSWGDSGIKTLTLIIINNRDKEIFREVIENGTCTKITIKPGLYYFQLQDNKETLFTGKFNYLPVSGQ